MELYISYAERGRTQWWRYPLTLAAGLLFAVVVLALFGVALAVLRLLPPDLAQQMQSSDNPWIFFSAIAVVFAALGAGLAAAAALIQRKYPGDIIGAWRWRLFLSGLLMWLVVQMILAGKIDDAKTKAGIREVADSSGYRCPGGPLGREFL